MNDTVVRLNVLVVLHNLALIGGAVWLVGWHDWSGWWFVLAIGLLREVETNEAKP